MAISYRLAACFTRIGSTCGIEIYWRSFRHFGNYSYSLRKIAGKKMTKIGQKLIKNGAKLCCFFVHFRIYSLKIFAGGELGARSPILPPVYAPVLHDIRSFIVSFYQYNHSITASFLPARRYARAVFARAMCHGWLAGCLAVCHSRYCIKTETASVIISSPSDSPLI